MKSMLTHADAKEGAVLPRFPQLTLLLGAGELQGVAAPLAEPCEHLLASWLLPHLSDGSVPPPVALVLFKQESQVGFSRHP